MQCPGQDSRYWDGDAAFEAKCPKCGNELEFFKDESTRKCKNCGHKVFNPKMDFGCATYCPFAEQCLGTMSPELLAKKQEVLLERAAVEMRNYFKDDDRRIRHALQVAKYAAEICEAEKAHPAIVLLTAYLHDIGIKESERKYQSAAPKYQHQEGPPIAREILEKLGAEPGVVDEVCDIISHHHHPRGDDNVNFKAVYDADLIVNLQESHEDVPISAAQLAKVVHSTFLTAAGSELAARVLAVG